MRKWLSNLKMTKKLLVSPTVAVVFLAVFGIVSYSAFFKQKAVLDDIFNNRFMYFQTAADILIDLKEVQASTMDIIGMLSQVQAESRRAENPKQKSTAEIERADANTRYVQQTIEEGRTKCKVPLDRVEKSLVDLMKSKQLSKQEKAILASVSEKVSEYHTQINDVLDVVLKDADSAQAKMTEAAGLFVDVDKEVHQLLTLERKLSKDQYTTAGTTFAVALTISLIVFIIAVILPLGISLIMKSMILSPIQKTVKAIEEVAKGDLTQRIEVESEDEIGQMAKHFNVFVENLHEVIGRVAKSSENVSQAAEALDRSSEQMAQDIDDAANRVGSLATASEEMSSTTASIAQNCVIAAKSSESASDLGRNGAAVIQSAISAMNRISNKVTDSASVIKSLGTRSDQIGNIVDLINDVADQTNLLALNAAIEAARAGEHGRGFAVVADEVRKLAERTSSATKEIGDTIKAMQSETKKAVSSMEEGVAEAETGTVEAAKSRQALEDILKQIATVTTEVNQIAVASEEENATTNEIAGSIQQISSVMQQTASKLQGNVDASHQLADLSKQLQEMVERFKL